MRQSHMRISGVWVIRWEIGRFIWSVETGFVSGCGLLLCCHRYWRPCFQASLIACLSVKRWMWAFRIIEDQVFSDCRASLGNGVIGMLVNFFIFDCPPQPSYEDIIPLGSSAIYTGRWLQAIIKRHGNRVLCVLQNLGKRNRGEPWTVNRKPWWLFNISGFPCRTSTSSTASMQKSISMVIENFHDKTRRMNQLITAAK
jgi:hypothetical protein